MALLMQIVCGHLYTLMLTSIRNLSALSLSIVPRNHGISSVAIIEKKAIDGKSQSVSMLTKTRTYTHRCTYIYILRV